MCLFEHVTDTNALHVQYIYISTEEMKAVAEYMKKRRRIAIGELAAKSNTFIDLEAKATAVSPMTVSFITLLKCKLPKHISLLLCVF